MKKIPALILSLIISIIISCVVCTSCTQRGNKNYERTTTRLTQTVYSDLYYDTDTKIVYFIFSEKNGNQGYGYMSPYYSSNGYLYKYDPNAQKLIEINK